jgi:hypothetical protein
MLNLDVDTPTIWWTFEEFEVLNSPRKDWAFGEATMQQDAIPEPVVINTNEIRFDPPESWEDTTQYSFKRNPDGSYTASGTGYNYRAVRAETETMIRLIGNFNEPAGKGVFIAGLPKSDGGAWRRT